ncbi:MAG: hypothetical protein N6V49_13650, partial [Serratia symbiotica]|nr:hypothetical protein [Serratia symbiotica]
MSPIMGMPLSAGKCNFYGAISRGFCSHLTALTKKYCASVCSIGGMLENFCLLTEVKVEVIMAIQGIEA